MMTAETQAMDPIIHCRSVTRLYSQGEARTPAVNSVDLDIARGDFVTLSGPSGSGKTTLLSLIGGLDRPTAGEIEVDGFRLSELNAAGLARLRLRRIGFVFQTYSLSPVLSAQENVEFPLRLTGLPARECAERAVAALAEVGLGGLEARRPAKMSGGQQQRVAVARALVARPAIVLADEPTANLDSANAEALIALMADLCGRLSLTFLIATHDARVIAHARRRLEMTDGRITDDRRMDDGPGLPP